MGGVVTFFHHDRVDDARRTGLYVDDSRAFERFVPGDEEYDPSLRWYVDVNVPVTELPATRAAAAEWLDAHAATVQTAIEKAAERLAAGMDSDGIPWSFDVGTAEGPVRVSVSAQRRLSATHIGRHLRELLTRDWPAFREEFRPRQAAVGR